MAKEKKSIFKKWWLWVIAVLIISLVISILYGVGKGVVLDEDKITYDELQDLIADKEKELKEITNELESNKDYYNEVQETAAEHEELLEAVVDYKVEITSLETEMEEKQSELDKLTGEIAKVIDEPIKVNSGTFYFGDDIEEGRYKVTNQDGQRGNIYFRGDEGFAETFGKGDYSVEEYTFNAYEGEEIQFDIPALLYPLE